MSCSQMLLGCGLEGWSPAQLTSLAAWYEAGPTYCWQDAGCTVACGDGDPIYTWQDRSGNGYHLTQSDILKRPTLRLVNGKWCARFDGVNDVLDWGSFSLTECSLYFVCKKITNTDIFVLIGGAGDRSIRVDGAGYQYFLTNAGATPGRSYTNDANIHAREISNDYAGVCRTSFDSSTHTQSGYITSDAVAVFSVGTCAYQAGQGDLSEMFYLARFTTEGERLAAMNYLKSKWGTP